MEAAEEAGVRGNQLRHFAQCIQQNTQPISSLEDDWQNLVVGSAILEACRERKVIDVI